MTYGQSHHAGEATVHASDGTELGMLDRVCASLVERIAGGNVVANFLLGVIAHGHIGDAEILE